ncbi:Protein of unknown function [Bacillus mycoides]|nr:Protein of unknown function [Bacillus mycoides]
MKQDIKRTNIQT